MLLYVKGKMFFTSERRLTISELMEKDFTGAFQLFEFSGDLSPVDFYQQLTEVQKPRFVVVSLSETVAANSLSPSDHIYGAPMKADKRFTHSNRDKADFIQCECGLKAYRHSKPWKPTSERETLFVCENPECRKIWKELLNEPESCI